MRNGGRQCGEVDAKFLIREGRGRIEERKKGGGEAGSCKMKEGEGQKLCRTCFETPRCLCPRMYQVPGMYQDSGVPQV